MYTDLLTVVGLAATMTGPFSISKQQCFYRLKVKTQVHLKKYVIHYVKEKKSLGHFMLLPKPWDITHARWFLLLNNFFSKK